MQEVEAFVPVVLPLNEQTRERPARGTERHKASNPLRTTLSTDARKAEIAKDFLGQWSDEGSSCRSAIQEPVAAAAEWAIQSIATEILANHCKGKGRGEETKQPEECWHGQTGTGKCRGEGTGKVRGLDEHLTP